MSSVPYRVCSVDGCERKHKARGFCDRHYDRFSRSDQFAPLKKLSFSDYFWMKVDSRGKDECWLWTGAHTSAGYGIQNVERHLKLATHVSWFLHHGVWPAPLFALHECDNPPCVNPNHLFLGTFKDNGEDMTAKGRQASKLCVEDVRKIRRLRTKGSTVTALGKQFGVHHGHISDICNRRVWRHVE